MTVASEVTFPILLMKTSAAGNWCIGETRPFHELPCRRDLDVRDNPHAHAVCDILATRLRPSRLLGMALLR